ncbi:MAG: DegT/DnrJ/EryC1/StrS family aminotransferase [Chloroflexota bacterium]
MTQSIPLVDLKAQYQAIQADIDEAIQRVITNTSFIMGSEVSDFEAAFAEFCGAKHCVGIASGTAALQLVLLALKIGEGDEVITASHTFIAAAEAISNVGAKPVFVEIDPHTYTLDPQAFEAAITPATKAVIPVHIYGQPAAMSEINRIAKAHHIWVVEDAAQAHGATWHDSVVGSRTAGNLADVACFSFYPGKNLGAYGDAGAVTTNNDEIAAQVASLRNHGRTSKYLHDQVGFGERIDALQAAILGAKMPYLADWTATRQRLAARYTELLADCDVVTPVVDPAAQSAWHLYVIRTPHRDEMLADLKSKGIGAGIHYPVPLHLQPAYNDLGYTRGELPITETVADTCLSLPIYPEMSETQQDAVVEAVKAFCEKR